MIVITPEYAKPLPNAEIIKKEFQETLQQNAKLKNRFELFIKMIKSIMSS